MDATVTAHWEILDPARLALVDQLAGLKAVSRYYLAGGTALALHAGHRRSVDFDFFVESSRLDLPDPAGLERALKRIKGSRPQTKRQGTYYVSVGDIRISFIATPYPLVKPVHLDRGIRLADPVDIGAMKLSAIVSRGSRRDFIDLACIIDRYAPLAELFRAAKRKYRDTPSFSMNALRATVYFADAEGPGEIDPDGLDPRYRWDEVKKTLEREARKIAPSVMKGNL